MFPKVSSVTVLRYTSPLVAHQNLFRAELAENRTRTFVLREDVRRKEDEG